MLKYINYLLICDLIVSDGWLEDVLLLIMVEWVDYCCYLKYREDWKNGVCCMYCKLKEKGIVFNRLKLYCEIFKFINL